MLTPKMKRRLKSRIGDEKPTIHIGKDGITTQMEKEISKQLNARELIKIKILKTALKDNDAKNIALSIANQTKSELIEVRGHTFILFKKKRKR
jgi:RNA-binding protein